jgi:hypothetical protein
LAKEPGQRYASAAALRQDLERFSSETWSPPAHGVPMLAAVVLLVLAGLGAVAATRGSTDVGGAGPPPTASAGPTLPPGADDPDSALEELERLGDLPPRDALGGLQAWLRQHTGHPQAEDARRQLTRLIERPLWTGALDTPPSEAARTNTHASWWDPGRIVLWHPYLGLEVWDVASASRLMRVETPELHAVTPLDRERLLLGLVDGRVRWLSAEGELLQEVQAFGPSDAVVGRTWGVAIASLELDPDGRRLWVGSLCGLIRALDRETGERLLELQQGEPVRDLILVEPDLLISANGWSVKLPQSQGQDQSARTGLQVWSRSDGRPGQLFMLGWRPQSIVRVDDLLLVNDVGEQVRLFRLAGSTLVPDGYLAGDGVQGRDRVVFLEGATALRGDVHAVAAGGGRIYACGGTPEGGEVRAWALDGRAQVRQWSFRHRVTDVAVSGDRLLVALSGRFEVRSLAELPAERRVQGESPGR